MGSCSFTLKFLQRKGRLWRVSWPGAGERGEERGLAVWQDCRGCRCERPVRVPWVRVPVIILFYFLSPALREHRGRGRRDTSPCQPPCHLRLCVAPGAEEAPRMARRGRAAGVGRRVRVCRADARPRCTGVRLFDSLRARYGECTPAGRRLCSRCRSGRRTGMHVSEFVSHGYEARAGRGARLCCAFAGRDDPGKAVVRSHHPVRVAVHGSCGSPM